MFRAVAPVLACVMMAAEQIYYYGADVHSSPSIGETDLGNAPDRLNGCGLIVANPPYTLRDDLAAVLPELAHRLAEGSGARHRLDRVVQTLRVTPVGTARSHQRKTPPR